MFSMNSEIEMSMDFVVYRPQLAVRCVDHYLRDLMTSVSTAKCPLCVASSPGIRW